MSPRAQRLGAPVTALLIVVGCGSDASTSWDPGEGGAGSSSGSASADGGTGSSSGGSTGSSGSSGGSSGSGSGGSSGGGSSSSGSGGSSGGSSSGGSSGSSGSGSSSGGGGGPISCPGPGSYTKNGGSCGTERWSIKTGTDSQASGVSLVPVPTTIAHLVSLPAAGGGTSRESPTETTLYELKDVTLTMVKLETDSDYHTVVSDGTNTMIVEFPYPTCAQNSVWSCFLSRDRAEVDSTYTVTSSPQYPSATVTVRGVGFFDSIHGQTGVAPNGIELHPVLQICWGQGCTPT